MPSSCRSICRRMSQEDVTGGGSRRRRPQDSVKGLGVLRDVLVEVGGAVVDAADVAPREASGHSRHGNVVLGFRTGHDGGERASALDFVAAGSRDESRSRSFGQRRESRNGEVTGGVVLATAHNFEPSVAAPVRSVAAE